MSFDTFLDSQLIEKVSDISYEEYMELKELFDKKNAFYKNAKEALAKQLNNSDGIDYTVQYEKNNAEAYKYSLLLEQKINAIKERNKASVNR